MLDAPVICLQAPKFQWRVFRDALREPQRLGCIPHTAATLADIDLDEDIDRAARRRGSTGQCVNLRDVVDAHAHARMPGQFGQQRRLGRAGEFIADVDIVDTGARERHGLTYLLAADAHCALGDLCN